MEVVVVNELDIGRDLDEQIRCVLCACFPDNADVFSITRAWHGSAPKWTVLLQDESGRIIAHVGIVYRTIFIGSKSVQVGGIQNVCVLPRFRGQGLCDRVMGQAANVMRQQAIDFGLLFCIRHLVKVYQRTGWKEIESIEITRIDEHGNTLAISDNNIAMCLKQCDQELPKGAIFLQGNDW